MKNQALFSLKDKSKNLKRRLLQFLFCVLRVNNKAFQRWGVILKERLSKGCFEFLLAFLGDVTILKSSLLL